MTYRLRAFHLWWFMRIVHIDNEGKDEGATLVHAWIKGMSTNKVCTWIYMRHTFIRSDGESEIEEVRGVGEVGDHSGGKVEFGQIL